MSTRRAKVADKVAEAETPRVSNAIYLVSKGAAEDIVKRVMAARAGSVIRLTNEEMRVWREHVAVINEG